jgi:hypothetical protein
MNPRFIIELIVRARNEVAATMNKIAGDIDKATKAQERGTEADKKRAAATATTTKKIEDAAKRFESYTKELERGNRSTEEAVKHLQGFRREFDRLGNAVKPGTDAADQLYRMGNAADQLARQIKQASDDAARAEAGRAAATEAASQRAAAARRREAQDFIKDVRSELAEDARRAKEFERNLQRGERPYRQRILAIQHGREEAELAGREDSISADEMIRRQRQIQAELAKTIRLRQAARSQAEREAADTRIAGHAQELRTLGMSEADIRRSLKAAYVDQDVDAAITKRQRLIHDLAEEQRRLGNQPAPQRSWISRFFSVDQGRLDAINRSIRDFERSADRGGFSAVRFAGNLRGMIIVGVLAFLQQLVGIGVALGGTLVSLASSAIQAGAALGGALAAGAAQALPIIGLLGAAWGRVGAVFDAVKQAQKARLSAADDEAASADKQRAAADSVRNAQESLANAQRSAVVAQENLTKARFDAQRQIEDLVQAEREAQLQAEASSQAQREALQTFRRSLASGDVDRVASNALQVRQASQQVISTGITRARATFDATKAVRGGVEGMDNVVAARRAVADAARGIASAQRQLQEARRDAGKAVDDVGSAQKQLQRLLGDLSPSERRLFEAIERVESRYKRVFTGRGGVLESIIDSFTYGVNKADELLRDRRLVGEATKLSDAIGSELRKAFDFASGDDQVDFFTTMSREARQNLPKVSSILEHVVNLIEHIALAGRGSLRRFLDFLDNLAGKADAASGSNSGLAKLERFFSTGERYAESWVRLGIAISRLFLAIIGQSADQGNKAIEDLTNNINKATDWINTHQKDVHQFFEDARESTGEVFKMVWALTKAIFSLFHPDQVSSFSHAIQETLVPTLQNILTVTGAIAKIFLDIASSPGGSTILTFLLTMIGLKAAISPLVVGIGRLAVFFGTLFQNVRIVRGGLIAIRIASGPLGIAIAAVASAVLILNGRFDKLIDLVKDMTPILGGLIGLFVARNGLKGSISIVTDMIGGLGKKIGGLKNLIPSLKGIFKGGGAAAEAGEAGAGLGAAIGGGAKTALFGLLKKAGWVGLGISAGQGILSGFKHHSVQAGVQDFFHSITFGIVKSADQVASEAASRIGKKLAEGRDLDLGQTTTTRVTGGRTPTPGITRLRVNTKDQQDFNKLSDAGKKVVDTIRQMRRQLEGLASGRIHSGNAFGSLYDQLKQFSDKGPPEFKSAIDSILDQAERFKRGFDMGVPAKDIQQFNKVIKGSANLFQDYFKSGRENLSGIRDATQRNMGVIKDVLGSDSLAGKKALAKNFSLAADAVRQAMDDGKIATKTGLAEIRRLMKKSLALYGIKGGRADHYLDTDTGDVFGKGSVGKPGSGPAQGGHTGGYLGLQGERGGDGTGPMIGGKATGRGEAVLTNDHQSIVNTAMAYAKHYGGMAFGSLNEMFGRLRTQHGPSNGFSPLMGRARGGYVQGAIEPPGGTPPFIRRLFNLAYKATSAFRPGAITSSGNVSDHASGHAWDFGNSVNNLRRLWAVVFPLRRQIKQLIGPTAYSHGLMYDYGSAVKIAGSGLQEDHEDHIHIAIGEAIRGALRNVANRAGQAAAEAIQHISAPKVRGSGALAGIVRGALGRATKAANDRLDELAGTSGGAGASRIPAFRGPWVEVMAKIAKDRGWSLRDWKRLVQGESGGNPEAVNPHSGAFGLGQFLGATLRAYARFGATSHDPTRQIRAMAQYIADRYGTATAALRAWLARSPHWYETGGAVPGRGPQGAVLHGGEHVWTASEVASLGGQQVMYALRRLLKGLATGGATAAPTAKGSAPQGSTGIKGPYTEPTIHGIDTAGLLAQVTRAQKVIASLRSSTISKKFTDSLSKSYQQLLGDGGLLDQMDDAVQRLASRLEVNLKRATYKLDGAGNAIKKLDDVGVADRTIKNLKDVYGALAKEQLAIQGSLDDVAARLKSGSLTKGERAYLTGVQRNLTKRLRDVQSSIADNVESQYEAIEQQIQVRVQKASDKASTATSRLDIIQRLRDLAGGSVLSFLGAPSNEAIGQQRADIFNTQADQLQKAADLARKKGHSDTADQIAQQITDLRTSALEAVRDGISKDVDEIGRQAGRRTAALDLRGRIAQALGRVGDLAGIAQDRIKATQDQIRDLTAKQAEASAKGFYDLAETIGDQIADLQTSITEITAQQLQDSIDQVNKTAQRASARFDLRDRLANLKQAAGDYTGAFADRAQTLADRGDSLAQQRNSLYGLLAQAQQQGNQGAVEDLTDQIAELDVSIAENTAAIKSNTVQARQAAIDAISNRGTFLGGVFGGLQNILTTLGQLSGTTDTNGIRSLLQQQGTTLTQTGSGLAQQLLEGYGVDVRGLSPAQLVTVLSGLNYDQIESGMSEEQRQQFEGLINAIIENTGAQVSNTQQLEQLNNPNTQTFTSTAWTWFRNAIFNGSGGLLSQYQNPSIGIAPGMTNALVTTPSPASLAVANRNASASSGDFNVGINVTEQVEDADPEVIASRLYNRYKTMPRS